MKYNFFSLTSLVHILLFELIIVSPKFTPKFNTELSFYAPYVGENGRSDVYTLGQDYMTKTYSSDTPYTQLGFSNGPTEGNLISKKIIGKLDEKNPNFKLEVKFSISAPSPGSFISFGLTRNKEPFENVKNQDVSYKGVLLTLFTENFPILAAETGLKKGMRISQENMKYQKVLKDIVYGSKCVLKLENIDGNFKVSLSLDSADVKEMFTISNAGLKNVYFSINSVNINPEKVEFKIYSVKTFDMVDIVGSNTTEKNVIAKKRGWFVWFIFLIALAAIAYYLFGAQFTKKA